MLMSRVTSGLVRGTALVLFVASAPSAPPEDQVSITGELKLWHKVTLTVRGPHARETDNNPNPFTDYRFEVTFTHESGQPSYVVPGYFAADGQAAETSATAGDCWRVHFRPDKTGLWRYRVSFIQGKHAALDRSVRGTAVRPPDGLEGTFKIGPTDKRPPDFRARGRLRYVGKRYLQFAGNGEYFLKAGADAPETFLAYRDFDGTLPGKAPLKTWGPHVRDWRPGDPVWKGDRGKGIIGALNYLASKGLNAVSFIPYNAGGDGDNVWPFVDRNDKLDYDVSKLEQWGIVFDHAQNLGLFLHFKLQETEMDDERMGVERKPVRVPEALDGGALGPERKLYCRELVARFGHALALNWNIGEENTQTTEEQLAMAAYLREVDPYDHPIVVHTYPNDQERVYTPLLGKPEFTGVSLQNPWNQVHQRTLHWIEASARAGHPWVVANDEQNPAQYGVPPDPGYQGFQGQDREGKPVGYTHHDIRKYTLWGNLMAGGAGVEYYFGYLLPQNDLEAEDYRSRDQSWTYCGIALEFFRQHKIPFWEMRNADELVGNTQRSNTRYCFAKPGELYLVYLPEGGTAELDLSGVRGAFQVLWFNPRLGGPLRRGTVRQVVGGGKVSLGQPPNDPDQDWLVVIRR